MPRSRFPTPVALLLPLALLVASCGGPASQDDALASSLERHLGDVAPGALAEDTRAAMEVEVLAVEAAADDELKVDFRVFDPRHPDAAVDSLRGAVHTAWLVEEGDGYAVRRYGEELARSVAVMIAADRRARYEDLLVPLLAARDSARGSMSDWAKPMRTEFRDASEARKEEIRQALDAGVPSDAFLRGLEARWTAPDDAELGVVDDEEGHATVVFLRDREDPDAVCAYRMSLQPPAAPWDWLVEEFATCQGRNGTYVEQYPPRAILEELPVRPEADPAPQG